MRTEDMRNMIVAAGGSVDDLPNNLPSTLRKRLIETMGGNCPDGNLPSDICNAFGSCGGTQNVVFADGMSYLGISSNGFVERIAKLVIPEGITQFDTSGYYDDSEEAAYGKQLYDAWKNLEKITLPRTVTQLRDYQFYEAANLKEVVATDCLTSIGVGAFCYSDVSTFVIPSSVVDIGQEAFAACKLKEIVFPNSITTLSVAVCSGCYDLEVVVLPDSLESIERFALANCTSLTEIEIPSSVNTISEQAFDGSTNLTKITINKPENSIAGAPWGATNATVVWTG